MVQENARVVSHTGRYATLVGYDPKHTRSKRIPIVTAYVKVRAHNGIPVLLKINEAVYNEGSPVTLLSEYQMRDHGYVVDSVAAKHKSSPNTYGTQRLILNDVVHVPFEDRGGIMGFEILPILPGEIDEVDPKLDIFEMTSPTKWVPARFRSTTIHEATIDTSVVQEHSVSHVDTLLEGLEGDMRRDVPGPIMVEDPTDFLLDYEPPSWFPETSFKVAAARKVYNSNIKPWH